MRSAILQSNFIEIAIRHGCSPVNLLHIFRIPFPRDTSAWLLLELFYQALFRNSPRIGNFVNLPAWSLCVYTCFFKSKTFISNVRLKLAKNYANAKQQPDAQPLLFENYSHSQSTLSSKNHRACSKK